MALHLLAATCHTHQVPPELLTIYEPKNLHINRLLHDIRRLRNARSGAQLLILSVRLLW